MKEWKNYVATCYVFDVYKNIEDEVIEEILRDAFQQKNPDAIIEKVTIDILYRMKPTIENTLKIYVHYKEEEESNEKNDI